MYTPLTQLQSYIQRERVQSPLHVEDSKGPSVSGSASGLGPHHKAMDASKRSWRSTGWKPLVYPSLALYDSNSDSNTNSNSANSINANKLSFLFPLQKDVILATIRELLILDGAVDSSTLEVIDVEVNSDGDSQVDDSECEDEGESEVSSKKQRKDSVGDSNSDECILANEENKSGNANENDNDDKNSTNSSSTESEKEQQFGKAKATKVKVPVSVSALVSASASASASASGSRKRKRGKKLPAPKKQKQKSKLKLKAKTNQKNVKQIGTTRILEDLIRTERSALNESNNNSNQDRAIVEMRSKGMDADIDANVDMDADADAGTPLHATSIANTMMTPQQNISAQALAMLLHDKMIERKAPMNVNVNANVNTVHVDRIRKVSDVDAMTTFTYTGMGDRDRDRDDATSISGNASIADRESPFAAHLAVTAINIDDQDTIIDSAIQELEACPDYVNSNHDEQAEALLLHLKQELPLLLDLSIMVEAQLRQIALQMVRALGGYFSEKALREFIGYKSPTAKHERVLELISDFLFDVSHAMFAWDKTEVDMFGIGNTENKVMQNGHDSIICKTLFDKRALRKIGGFEPSSLIYHALSIKRLRSKGETWGNFTKTTIGKKMFLHHKDNLARARAGARRRDKRMKKNLALCYPMNVKEERERTRSRSSSFTSVESSVQNSDLKICLPDNTTRNPNLTHCISPTFPDVIPITISREVGKSWGILLAREGSMCVVMRVPDDKTTELQRGDLIVSIRNEGDEYVNTPTLHSSSEVSPEWFSEAVGMFKRSDTLYLDVRRVSTICA